MHTGKIVNERTSLTRPLHSPDYVEFSSLLRKRKSRVRQFQCCVCATFMPRDRPADRLCDQCGRDQVHGCSQGMPSTETTSLTGDRPARVYYARDALPFYSHRRKQQLRLRCVAYTIAVAIFTMALIVTISYSVSHDIIDLAPNLTTQPTPPALNLTRPLKLGFASGSGSYTVFSDPTSLDSPQGSIFVSGRPPLGTALTDDEIKVGLEAGRQAINDRLFADAVALVSPLPSPSPESRHRYAVSTCPSVGRLALAAVAEIAATKRIEKSRANLGASSATGIYFDGGWVSQGVCKQLSDVDCQMVGDKYRTFDGSCNRPMQRGASMTPYKRLLPPSYADGVELPRRASSGAELPSAREVSLKVHKPSPSSNPRFTVMLAVYGQFLDHDITATAVSQGLNGSSISCCPPAVGHPECFPVPVSKGDPVFDVTGRECMDFVRSAPAPQCKLGPRQQLNQVTAFIDGSAVYGSDSDTACDLREFAGGRLRMQRTPDNRTLLPASMNQNDGCNRETERLRGRYCFAAGDARANENLHLTTMHLLWARQHNRIADELAKRNPSWDDEKLYQESRRIVGAQLQHITYREFIPIVLGEQETGLRDLRPLSSGHREWTDDPDDPDGDPSIANNFAAAAFRFAHTLLPGLMKVTDEQRGTSSYVELHRMLFNPYSLYTEGGVKSSVTTATRNMIQMTSTHVTSQLTNHLFEDPVANLTVPCGLDLVSLNIQRGRDHGLPGYTKWREYCGLGRVNDFSDLDGHMDSQALQGIAELYESVHDVDLYTGALAELPKTGGIVGPTFSCLIADQFVRLRKGDRFWYELAGQPHSFTEDQLAELRKSSLARLICDCSDGVTQTQAEVMRSIGPDNPVLTCEDIPAPSFEPWRERPTPVLQASIMPFDWAALKNNINTTIRDVVTYINSTKAAATLDADWLATRDYINHTFSELKKQLAELHPPKVTNDTKVPKERLSAGSGTFILRATGPGNVYQDWIAFKSDLVNSLNDSIATMGGGPAVVAKWMAFRKNVIDHFADLKVQVSSLKADVKPKLEAMKADWQPMSMNWSTSTEMKNMKDVAIPAIFDWKNFKDNILSSLDETITNISANMPPPGDPAWASFGDDIEARFVAFRDKTNGKKSAVAPVESAIGKMDSLSEDLVARKADAVKEMNDALIKMKNEMPPPGDPAWATYRDEITKSFAAFKSAHSPLKLASSAGTADDPTRPSRKQLAASTSDKLHAAQLSNLTNNWSEFRGEINDTLAKFLESIKSKKPTTIDPVAWSAFRISVTNDMAKFKDEIARIRGEWLAMATGSKDSQKTVPKLQATLTKSANYSKFDYTKFFKPAIPPEEWADFKRAINETVMNILNEANSTEKIDYDEFRVAFGKSFAELKDQITSLRNMIDDVYGNKTLIDWHSFQTQLNSTVDDLQASLSKEKPTRSVGLMRILFETKDNISDLRPPTDLSGVSPMEWMRYISRINTTIFDSLKAVNDQKYTVPLLRAATDPLTSSSSDDPKEFNDWLIISSLVGSLHVFTMISRYQIRL